MGGLNLVTELDISRKRRFFLIVQIPWNRSSIDSSFDCFKSACTKDMKLLIPVVQYKAPGINANPIESDIYLVEKEPCFGHWWAVGPYSPGVGFLCGKDVRYPSQIFQLFFFRL